MNNPLAQQMFDLLDNMESLEQRLKYVEDRCNTFHETFVRNEPWNEQVNRLHQKIEDSADLLSDAVGLPVLQVTSQQKLGARIQRLEDELTRQRRTHIELLTEITQAMTEVKGQISDPIHQTSAIERLRQDIKAEIKKIEALT